MIKLTERHLEKLAIITELPLEKVTEFDTMGLFDSARAVELLIKYDWKLLKRQQKKYTAHQRIMAIANEYNITEHRVKQAIYTKRVMGYFCKKCGMPITKVEHSRNRGLCEKCTIESIKIQ